MFTGCIETLGTVISINKYQEQARLSVDSKFSAPLPILGDSIAVNGVCLTITDIDHNKYTFDVSSATLNMSNIGKLAIGDKINLERALKFNQRLNGHLVTGHVDTTVKIEDLKIEDIKKKGSYKRLGFSFSDSEKPYLVSKGSIALDGISLTIGDIDNKICWVTIIPYTILNTNLKYKNIGDYLNLETDLIGKYVQRQLLLRTNATNSKLTIDKILQSGF